MRPEGGVGAVSLRCGRFSVREGCGLRLDRDEALGYLGYTGQQVDESLLARFHTLAESCERLTCARFVWDVFDVDASRSVSAGEAVGGEAAGDGAADGETAAGLLPCVALRGCELVLPGGDIARHLEGACKVALMACTLGLENDRELRKHAALGAADGVMFGACASALVEAAGNAAEAQIVAEAASLGLRTNWRYSPGYGDLPLSVQPAFLAALDATRRIGLSVTDTCMLVPQKSITAIVGLFEPGRGGGGVRDACSVCQLRACCALRAKGTTCHG